MFRQAVIWLAIISLSFAEIIEHDDALLPPQRTGYIEVEFSPDDPALVEQDYHAAHYHKRLPKQYDTRTIWSSDCPAMAAVSNQGDCGCCWAVSTSDVIRDRMCIAYEHANKYYASAWELMNCIPQAPHNACQGGNTLVALKHFVEQGIVSGGPYHSAIGCKPFQIHTHVSERGHYVPSDCRAECENPSYPVPYQMDKKYGKNARQLQSGPNIVQDIQWELFLNGPVVASFSVYDSFFHFWNYESKDAVYKKYSTEHQTNGSHAVRVVGWGTADDGTDFWTFVNSWGNHSRRHGEGRFARGRNECGIEDRVSCVDV